MPRGKMPDSIMQFLIDAGLALAILLFGIWLAKRIKNIANAVMEKTWSGPVVIQLSIQYRAYPNCSIRGDCSTGSTGYSDHLIGCGSGSGRSGGWLGVTGITR